MLVEDDPAAVRTIRRALGKYEVVTVGSCAEARARWPERQWAGAIFDIRLRDGSGLEVACELRDAAPRTQMLIISGHVDRNILVDVFVCGAFFLMKPLDNEQLTLFAERAEPGV